MQIADFFQRFGADGTGYRRTRPADCKGRLVCVDCPRDHHSPPLLPFRLPVHVRLHRERFPDHAIRFWCWTHYSFEEEGADLLTQEAPAVDAALAVCRNCRNIFLWTTDSENCILCGNPPTWTIDFGASSASPQDGSVGADAEAEAPAPPTRFGIICPGCDLHFDVEITPDAITPIAPPTPAAEPEAEGALTSQSPEASAGAQRPTKKRKE